MAYYKGPGLPTHVFKYPTIKTDLDLLRDSITTILCTCKGQRLFNPEFGSRLCHLLFEPDDFALQILAEETIKEAIHRWEPRVEIIGVLVTNDAENSTLKIDISLVEKRLNLPFNLPLTISRESTGT